MATQHNLISTPRSLEIAITGKCSLRCTYCSHFSNQDPIYEDLPKKDWFIFFKELGKNSVMTVAITGGEPFLRPDIAEIVQSIVDNRMRFSILSNGTLITEDIACFLASLRRCDYVQISIDGANDYTHDSCCGSGSFQKAINGVNLLRKYKIPVFPRVTLHKQNFFHIKQIAHFLLEEMNFDYFWINSVSRLGMGRLNSKSVCLDSKEKARAMFDLNQLSRKFGDRIQATAGPLAELKRFQEMQHAKDSGLKTLDSGGYLIGCSCIWSQLAVRNDGMIIPCILLPDLELGRINQNDLKTIWNSHPILTEMRQRQNINLSSIDFCNDCPYQNYCTGNCPAIAWSNIGRDLNHPDLDSCFRKFLAEGGILPFGY